MLDITDLELYFGDRAIVKKASFSVKRKERIGLIGKNGAGKSTLLKLITGELKPDGGSINLEKNCKIGYLHQDLDSLTNLSVREEIKSALQEMNQMQDELEAVQHEMETRTDYQSDSYMSLLNRFDTLQSQLMYFDPNETEKDIELIADGLGFSQDALDESVETLSGGWKMRVELAKLLITKPDILLLDEPTNHLDIASIIWMESWLNEFDGAAIIISHDIQFLDNTTNRSIEIVNAKLRDYPHPYSKYRMVREEELEIQQQAYENQQRQIKQKERIIEKFRAKSSKAKTAQAMIKELDRLEKIDAPDLDPSAKLNIRFPEPPRAGKVIYDIKDLGHSYDGEAWVFKNVDLKIERGDRIAFIGQNGQGKSTLAKIIAGKINAAEGEVIAGHNVDLGYFAQDQTQVLPPDQTVLQVGENHANPETRTQVRAILGAFMFSGEDAEKKVKVLSGGERMRLALSLLIHEKYNVLLLDEPTNHLDIDSKQVLKDALQAYEGTVLVVSHDRDFLSGLVDKTLAFRDRNVKLYLDDVDTYLEKHAFHSMRDVEKMSKEENENEKADAKKIDGPEQYALEKKIRNIERKIEELQKKKATLEEKMSVEGFYEKAESENTLKKHAQLSDDIKKRENEWETLIIELEG